MAKLNYQAFSDQLPVLLKFKHTWAFNVLKYMPHGIVSLFTGNRCLGGESMIYDPMSDVWRRVDNINDSFHVGAWDGTKAVIAKAEKPYKKEKDDLYRFSLSSGQSFVASKSHQILTPLGYRSLSEVPLGCDVFRPPTISDTDQLLWPSDARHYLEKTQDFQGGYQEYHHLHGELVPCLSGTDQVFSPLQDGVQKCNESVFEHLGGMGCTPPNTGFHDSSQCVYHLSNQGALCRIGAHGVETLSHTVCTSHKHTCGQDSQVSQQRFCGSVHQSQCNVSTGRSSKFDDDSLDPPLLYGDPVQVTSVTYLRNDYKWDFGVPYYNNYIHAGIVHHNSMKTASIAFLYVLRLLGWHPVPFRNVLYFECENISDRDKHPMMTMKLPDGSKIPFARRGQFADSFYTPIFKEYQEKEGVRPIWLHPEGVLRPDDNICPFCKGKVRIKQRTTRVIRFAAAKLPTDKAVIAGGQSAEISSPQYPELKKWLPPALIKKDITARNPAITIFDINSNIKFGDEVYEGGDIIIEFVGYHQEVQDTAGVPRLSVWLDEHSPFDFFEESYQRIYEEDGDMILTLTPAMGMNWEHDDIFEKASLYVRTEAVTKFLTEQEGKEIPQIEHTDSEADIVAIQAATDDNPTLDMEVVEKRYKNMPDPDGTVIATRRYGIFKEATGRIFKDFNFKIHKIDPKKYGITAEVISSWRLGRTIDFHPANPHAILWAGISKEDELFIYQEWAPSPDKFVLKRLCRRIAEKSGDDRFSHNLIDPLANIKNQDYEGTKKTSIEIINKHFYQLKKDGIGAGGFWSPYNTKGEVGRDAIKERLANALKVGKPFDNLRVEDGRKIRLPTMWVFNECVQTAASLRQWSMETWASSRHLTTKDKKESPAQKWSHFPTALEGLLKEKGFKGATGKGGFKRREYRRFRGRR